VLHNQVYKNKHWHWQSFLKIMQNQTPIIIGTRSAILSPYANLKTIIIDSSASPDYHQVDQNPRYDARTVADQLQRLLNIKVIYSSLAHRVNDYFKVTSKKNWEFIASRLNFKQAKMMPAVKLIDLSEEWAKKNFSLISESLELAIDQALASREKIFLFLHRLGYAKKIICADCSYIFKCSVCSLELHLGQQTDKELFCPGCGFKAVWRCCPKCQSFKQKLVGWTLGKVKNTLSKLYPGANLGQITTKNFHQLADIIRQNNIILFSTKTVFSKVAFKSWPKIAVIGLLKADSLLNIPNYQTSEKTGLVENKIILFCLIISASW